MYKYYTLYAGSYRFEMNQIDEGAEWGGKDWLRRRNLLERAGTPVRHNLCSKCTKCTHHNSSADRALQEQWAFQVYRAFKVCQTFQVYQTFKLFQIY